MAVKAPTPFGIVPEWLLYSGVSGSAVKLYGILARHASNNGHGAYPSHARMAELAGLSIPTVKRRLRELMGVGAIAQTPQFGPKRERLSNEYRLLRGVPVEQLSLLVENAKKSTTKKATAKKATPKVAETRPHDPLWEALAEAFGKPPKSARYRTAWGVALVELREQGATAEQIRARVQEARQSREFQWTVATVTALAKHWNLPIGAEKLATQARGRAWADEFAQKGAS